MRAVDNLDQFTDGQEYGIGDMVKADPRGCEGCHACCLGVGDFVTLSPHDVFMLLLETKLNFAQLTAAHIDIKTQGKLSLPYLKTQGKDQRCTLLNDQNRCSVHPSRPDICRLFPLARVYNRDDFHYTLQVEACVQPKLDKIKVKKHLEIDHYNTYKTLVWSWYLVVKALTFRLKFARAPEDIEAINKIFWEGFYDNPTLHQQGEALDFIEAYFDQLPQIKEALGIL